MLSYDEIDIYKPSSILVTGGAGFIGGHVVKRLVEFYPNTKITVLDNLSYCASIKTLEPLKKKPNFNFVLGSINSADLVAHIMKSEKIDCVLHFAAETHVDNSFGNSFNFTMTNVLGTHVLLEAAKECKDQITRFIHVSTDEVYGENKEDEIFGEGSVLEPTNPYAATKASAELLVKAYHRSFNLPIIITRGNNVYGPQQYPEKVIPKFINQLLHDLPMTIHGTGQTHRNLLYVDDVADAFICLLQKGKPGETINIGGSSEYSVLEIAYKLLSMMNIPGKPEERMKFVEDRRFNDTRYNICCSKLISLGWCQKVTFEEGLQRTIDFYKNNPNYWTTNLGSALEAHPILERTPSFSLS